VVFRSPTGSLPVGEQRH